jgi:hypothetical protein
LVNRKCKTELCPSSYSKASDPLSNFKLVEDFGIPAWVGVLVRLSDKYSRIVQLTNKALNGEEAEVKEESIKDTLVDLANYSVIAIILFEEWLKENGARDRKYQE